MAAAPLKRTESIGLIITSALQRTGSKKKSISDSARCKMLARVHRQFAETKQIDAAGRLFVQLQVA